MASTMTLEKGKTPTKTVININSTESRELIDPRAYIYRSKMGPAALNWAVLGAVAATRAFVAAQAIAVARCSRRRGISDEEGVNISLVASLALGWYRRLAKLHPATALPTTPP
jgi:hypothetical protein